VRAARDGDRVVRGGCRFGYRRAGQSSLRDLGVFWAEGPRVETAGLLSVVAPRLICSAGAPVRSLRTCVRHWEGIPRGARETTPGPPSQASARQGLARSPLREDFRWSPARDARHSDRDDRAPRTSRPEEVTAK
jgi:hypothetical protein